MASPPKRPIVQLAVVAVLAAILALLAVLQYRWSLEVSRAERARMEAGLNASVTQFRQEFYRELAQVCAAFHRDPAPAAGGFWTGYAERYQSWSRAAAHPDLVANVYVMRADANPASRLLLLRPALARFEPAGWPARMADLRTRLEEELRGSSGPPGPEVRLFGWTLEERIPALAHPVFQPSQARWPRAGQPPGLPHRLLGFVIVELSAPVLEQHLLAELAQRCFGGPDGLIYYVAVAGGDPAGGIVYRSDPGLTRDSFQPPDARIPLLGPPAAEHHIEGGEPPPRAPGPEGFGRMMLRARGAVILPAPGRAPWELLVRHRGGSLESVVAADRRRNLLVSFGVLLLLAASMAMIIVSSQRARRLAHLQMEFVAGVSHELRTPVAVICSAADNLAEGLVGAKEQVKEYGALIRNEGRRLAGMIEQILYFAAGQAGRAHYELRPVSVAGVIEDALTGIAALPDAEGFTVERQVEADLPPVQADPAALTRCLQNLVLNAWKHGGQSGWARVRAEKTGADGASAVRISVEDRGPGIEAADLPHIFEPFYRGKAARAAQIHGAGLGLSLAREIAEAMGGRLSAASRPGHGSIFSLELPVAAQTAEALPRTA
jgi:signal transduction histidine kinase/Tfp pilus assembly protein PilE